MQASTNGHASGGPSLSSLFSWAWVLSLVYGGCCTNAFTLENLLTASTSIGSALTFFQMAFIALQGLPSFIRLVNKPPFIRLKPRIVPLSRWSRQVAVLWSMSLLNNVAFAYDVPLTLQIVFRSGGLAVSMLFGYLFLGRRYSFVQILSITVVTAGVIQTTLSRPTKARAQDANGQNDYTIGILLLTAALFLTGYMGLLQEETYRRYGPCWKEGLFYTHFLSLPLFLPISPTIWKGILAVKKHPRLLALALPINLFSQLSCVAGVNMLTSRVSSVSTNLVLTSRKAVSLVISVLIFRSEWNTGMTVGSSMVGMGTIAYAWASKGPTGKVRLSAPVAKAEEKSKIE